MKWKDVKEVLNNMTDEQLDQDAIVVNDDLCVSNAIQKIEPSKEEMFIDYQEDYPCSLKRKSEIEEEDFESFDHYWSEGHFIGYF
jgi:hypothetical protein